MENKEIQKQIIEAMILNEKAMEKLYKAYARKFPVFEKFWSDIAKEEESHAAWIKTLYEKTRGGLVDFAEQRFPLDAIRTSTKYTNEEIEKVDRGELSFLYALETATHMERGMLENKFFTIFKDDSVELQMILEALRLGTQEHLRTVQKKWESESKGNEMEKMTA
jgi:hypothetical protein